MKKLIEDQILAETLDSVITSLCGTLATRSIQEVKKFEAKQREEAGIYLYIFIKYSQSRFLVHLTILKWILILLSVYDIGCLFIIWIELKAREEEEARKEAEVVAEKERKVVERKNRREFRKKVNEMPDKYLVHIISNSLYLYLYLF